MSGLNAVVYLLIALGAWAMLIRRRSQRLPFPPGPSKFPLIGNVFDMPGEKDPYPWISHLEKYGRISSVSVLGSNVVILNNLQACIDVLNKCSAIYSGRPILPFAGEIVGWNKQMLLSQYDNHFRAMRRLLKSYIGTPAALLKLQSAQTLEARILLGRMLEKPENMIAYFRVAVGAITLKISYGYHIKLENDPLVELVETTAKEFYIATRPGAWLVDIIPFVNYLPNWFPGVKTYRKIGTLYRKHNMEQSELPYNFVKRQIKNGVSIPCFVSTMLEKKGVDFDTERAIKFGSTTIYAGGLDTTTATLSAFLLFMVLHPDVQCRAQEELDKVTASERLPSFEDREKLPYVDAIIKEVLRCHTLARADDESDGYFIPKDSIIIQNMWFEYHHDPSMYIDPDVFNPSRFVANGDFVPELDPTTYIYGFGRRACPGSEFANEFLFIIVSIILSAFDIRKKKDENGVDVEPVCEFGAATICHPVPFLFS
ncbi:cytochrome P450 oxidoreductase OrdA-like protein [Cyathus striatus]|nr:cytochrome P450 oxidoreductase OrdA-like protein [Cyathus striatus]